MLGGFQDRRSKIWRIAAVFAATGALALSGCSSSSEPSGGDDSPTAAAPAEKVDAIANTVPEAIKSSGKLIVGVNIPYAPNEFKDPERQDRRLRRRPDERDRRDAGADPGVPRGRLRQDHPVDPGRHVQRRACRRSPTPRSARSRSTSSPTSPRARCGPSRPGGADRPEQRVRQEGRGAGDDDPGDRRAARQEQGVHRRRQAGRSRSSRSTARTPPPTPSCSVRPTRCRRIRR